MPDRQRILRIVGALVVLVAVPLYAYFGDAIREQLGLGRRGLPPRGDDTLRIATFNLENFPGDHQDLERLRETLLGLEADLVAVQEVKDPEALQQLVPELALEVSKGGGRGHQRLGFLYDPATLEIVGEPTEHAGLTLGGRVRPAYSARLRAIPEGPDFFVVVVHLKAMPDGLDERERQWPQLLSLIERMRAEDPDVIVLGDFNVVGGPDGADSESEELDRLDELLEGASLVRIPNETGCSAYWDGARRDAWKEPSLLDLIYVASLEEADVSTSRAHAGGHCGRHRCQPLRSTKAHPDLDYARVSDHCPVVMDVTAGVDDD